MILIDADILAYRVGAACNEEELEIARRTLDNNISSILCHPVCSVFGSDYELFITGEGNFREEIATTAPYKGNRKAEKPIHLQELKQHMVDKWESRVSTGEEADDLIAIEATALKDRCLMVSIDKDFDQLPGWHFNFVTDLCYYITPEAAERFLWAQCLIGDRIDNIVGVYGIGEKKAEKWLSNCSTPEEYYLACVDAFVLWEGLSRKYAEMRVQENMNLCYLRRTPGDSWVAPETGE